MSVALLSRFFSQSFECSKVRRVADVLAKLEQGDALADCLEKAREQRCPFLSLTHSTLHFLDHLLHRLYDSESLSSFSRLRELTEHFGISQRSHQLILRDLHRTLSSNRPAEARHLFRKLSLSNQLASDFLTFLSQSGRKPELVFRWVAMMKELDIAIGFSVCFHCWDSWCPLLFF